MKAKREISFYLKDGCTADQVRIGFGYMLSMLAEAGIVESYSDTHMPLHDMHFNEARRVVVQFRGGKKITPIVIWGKKK